MWVKDYKTCERTSWLQKYTNFIVYSRRLETETADLSQSHACLNLSQFQTDCLLPIYSCAAILNYFKLFESILGIVTTVTNEKYLHFTLLKNLIGMSGESRFIIFYTGESQHSLFFINDECITWQFKVLFN